MWFGRGGYGACRLIEAVLPQLAPPPRPRPGSATATRGALLAALYQPGVRGLAHGPMPQDILREGGEAAVARALAWLVDRDRTRWSPAWRPAKKAAAFNITILCSICSARRCSPTWTATC